MEPIDKYHICARHGKPRKDAAMRHYYLCNKCASDCTKAYSRQRPEYKGESLVGYCQMCNNRTSVRLRAWLLCACCDRVTKSIGRNRVAEKALMDYLENDVLPHLTESLDLEQTDIARLRGFEQQQQSGQDEIDFIARLDGKPIWLVEAKTGRSSARGKQSMTHFQLDMSDCDAITRAMERHSAPAYVVHVEVLERHDGPTVGYYCRSMWWTDAYGLREHFKKFESRGGIERGKAVWFGKKAFLPIEELLPHVKAKKLTKSYHRRKQGAFQLYGERNRRK